MVGQECADAIGVVGAHCEAFSCVWAESFEGFIRRCEYSDIRCARESAGEVWQCFEGAEDGAEVGLGPEYSGQVLGGGQAGAQCQCSYRDADFCFRDCKEKILLCITSTVLILYKRRIQNGPPTTIHLNSGAPPL